MAIHAAPGMSSSLILVHVEKLPYWNWRVHHVGSGHPRMRGYGLQGLMKNYKTHFDCVQMQKPMERSLYLEILYPEKQSNDSHKQLYFEILSYSDLNQPYESN